MAHLVQQPANIAVNIPTGEFADIATSNQAVATALEDLPINTAMQGPKEVLAGQKLKDLQEERGQKALDMDQVIKEAYKDGVVCISEELAGIEKMGRRDQFNRPKVCCTICWFEPNHTKHF